MRPVLPESPSESKNQTRSSGTNASPLTSLFGESPRTSAPLATRTPESCMRRAPPPARACWQQATAQRVTLASRTLGARSGTKRKITIHRIRDFDTDGVELAWATAIVSAGAMLHPKRSIRRDRLRAPTMRVSHMPRLSGESPERANNDWPWISLPPPQDATGSRRGGVVARRPKGRGPSALPGKGGLLGRGSAPGHCSRNVRLRYIDHAAHRKQQIASGRKVKRRDG